MQILSISNLTALPLLFKVSEFSCAVKIGGVSNYVVVDMLSVNVRTDNESVVALQKPFLKLITYLVYFLGSDLSVPERLSHLVGNNIIFLLTSSKVFIAFL